MRYAYGIVLAILVTAPSMFAFISAAWPLALRNGGWITLFLASFTLLIVGTKQVA
jgi:hypothetical protein